LETKSHYKLIGLAVLLLTAGLIATALWLSVGFDQKSYHKYIIYITEPVSGLNDDAPVKYNGVRVGFIEDISLSVSDPQTVKIVVSIADDVPITQSTEASLVSQGITGTTYLGLIATSNDLTPLTKPANERYPVIPYKPSFFYLLEKSNSQIRTMAAQLLYTRQ
jgi:phospholipid/cholesterol/gamma-HCH transport system substrate-binding protein